jgi:hypothetical protein
MRRINPGVARARRCRMTLAVALLTLAVSGLASATAFGCEVKDLRTQATFGSLEAAVTAAAPGDTLKVHATCAGDTEITKNLTIEGGVLEEVSHNPPLDAVRVAEHVTAEFKGMTISGGELPESALVVEEHSSVILSYVTVEDTKGAEEGGIGQAGESALRLNHTTVTSNVSGPSDPPFTEGGGGGVHSFGDLNVEHSSIEGNTAEADAGGISSVGPLTIIGSVIAHNKGGEVGGGISSFSSLLIEGSTIKHNSTSDGGGGVSLVSFGAFGPEQSAVISSSVISDNSASYGGGILIAGPGGKVFLEGDTAVVNNTASTTGGGIDVLQESGGSSPLLKINGSSRVTGNQAGENGGGIFNEGETTLTGSAAITDNKAALHGGGIYDTAGATFSQSGGSVTLNKPDNLYTAP